MGLASVSSSSYGRPLEQRHQLITVLLILPFCEHIKSQNEAASIFHVYNASYDVVNLLLPLNALNFDDDTDDEDDASEDPMSVLFFVLADNVDGKRVDQGLYIRKKGEVTKLLDNGRDAAAANDDTKTAYFGAQDGIYAYNDKENKAEKYGTITDSIISIAKVNGSDIIYILTDDHILYKVTEAGTTKAKIEGAVNAQKIVLDYENNLYYYTDEKKVYVVGDDGIKQITGLPEDPSYIELLKPPFVLDNGVPVVVNDLAYIAYPNATSETSEFGFETKPSAYAPEATLIQYYAYNKKIYEYNILTLLTTIVSSEMQSYLEGKAETISEIATRSRSDLVP
ncbi:unnamed protein product [Arctia plantaginis]|uniref:Uncharacterized protein n=1 Tax=Arctia plantaginis TaxID=874455 RepID=A0A8S1AXT8_ARCPL|nr:unnamed protein product [Arctia plantaginis]